MSMFASTPPIGAETTVEVVAGVLACGEQILVAQRLPGDRREGKWEFPGGKVHCGESARQALARELREELGISVQAAHPLIRVRHEYNDKTVFLDVWRVTAYEGEPIGREGQCIKWVHRDALTALDWLEANRPIVQAVRLPALYLITDAERVAHADFLPILERALRAGARLLQLRAPQLESRAYEQVARSIVPICHRYGAQVLLNADPELVRGCGADGVHLNSRRLRASRTRPLGSEHWVAASTHDAEELACAAALGVDFVVLAPVLPSLSHPQRPALGWERFRALVAASALPAYALGGMGAEHLSMARAHGAQGLSMVRGVWAAANMETIIAALA